MRLVSSIKADITFQFRHYLYYAYLIVSMLYILLLYWIPLGVKEQTAMFLLFSDCSFLGSFFIGGIILLEKDQGIYDHLFVTPIRVSEFIWSKVVSLGVLSIISSLIIFGLSFGLSWRLPLLILGVGLNSIFASLLGFIFAVQVKSINQYLMISPLFVTVFFLPVLEVLKVWESPILYFIPGKAGLLLMEGVFTSLSFPEWIYSITMLLLAIFITYKLSYNSFYKHIILRIGG
ncbi:hypothetical protein SM124_08195 [Bacillus sp. 31A1R]|uniref:Fluoroquinolone transport system permease protein n=1 Tax=Robertmurraya mangrovi TaxID=3098077 RepID=A0ABU5IX46_9BACI|nr:hypothetical protein [Bacillus sp. 31A1R]MDZ5471725.1 hypothetical protein [Bacillus sp. 31A1R]